MSLIKYVLCIFQTTTGTHSVLLAATNTGHVSFQHLDVPISWLEINKETGRKTYIITMEEGDEMSEDFIVFHEDIQEENEEGVKEILSDYQGDGLDVIRDLCIREIRLGDCDPPEWGMSAVHRAAAVGNTSILELLLNAAHGLNLNLRVKHNGLSPLHLATAEGQTAMVSYLAANGADIDAQDKYGRSAMHLVAERDHRDLAQILGVKGVKVNLTDSKGQTPLHAACRRGHSKIVSFLLKKDADINQQDELGQSGLHKAQTGGHLEVTELLIGQGAQVNLQDKEKNTPLHLAVQAFNKHGKYLWSLIILHHASDSGRGSRYIPTPT